MNTTPELLRSLVRRPDYRTQRSITDTAADFWQKNANDGVGSYEDWLEARKAFRSQTGNIPVPIRGGGRGMMFVATDILKKIPNAHVKIYDDADVLGGMAHRAISSFITGHIPAKTAAVRDGMRLLMHPRVDVVPNTKLTTQRFADIVTSSEVPVAIDAPGAVPKRGDYPYGNRVWDIMNFVGNVNAPYDNDGHFGNVKLPEAFTPRGSRLPIISVVGGNTGRDAHVAFGLVETARDIATKFGIPIEQIDQVQIMEHGIVRTRQELGLPPILDQYLYRRPLGEMSGVKKLFPKTGNLERGNPELAEILINGIKQWEAGEGGMFLGNTELDSVTDNGEKISAVLRHNGTGESRTVDASLALISTGFEAGEPFRVATRNGVVGTDVGIKVTGGGDLASTSKSAREVSTEIIEKLTATGTGYDPEKYRQFLEQTSEELRATGMATGDEAVPVDPVKRTLTVGPRFLLDKHFVGITPEDRPPVDAATTFGGADIQKRPPVKGLREHLEAQGRTLIQSSVAPSRTDSSTVPSGSTFLYYGIYDDDNAGVAIAPDGTIYVLPYHHAKRWEKASNERVISDVLRRTIGYREDEVDTTGEARARLIQDLTDHVRGQRAALVATLFDRFGWKSPESEDTRALFADSIRMGRNGIEVRKIDEHGNSVWQATGGDGKLKRYMEHLFTARVPEFTSAYALKRWLRNEGAFFGSVIAGAGLPAIVNDPDAVRTMMTMMGLVGVLTKAAGSVLSFLRLGNKPTRLETMLHTTGNAVSGGFIGAGIGVGIDQSQHTHHHARGTGVIGHSAGFPVREISPSFVQDPAEHPGSLSALPEAEPHTLSQRAILEQRLQTLSTSGLPERAVRDAVNRLYDEVNPRSPADWSNPSNGVTERQVFEDAIMDNLDTLRRDPSLASSPKFLTRLSTIVNSESLADAWNAIRGR